MLMERANKGLHDYVFNLISESTPAFKGCAVMDIGCGTGAWLSRFADNGAGSLLGLDLDTQQFAVAGIAAKAMNLDNYTGEVLGSFDLITALELIEHLANPGQLLRLIQNNLATGGRCYISTPNIHALPARLRYLFTGRLPHFDDKSDPTHINPVYIENLERLLPRYGLKLVALYHFPTSGYNNYKVATQMMAKLAAVFLGDRYHGDNLVFQIEHV